MIPDDIFDAANDAFHDVYDGGNLRHALDHVVTTVAPLLAQPAAREAEPDELIVSRRNLRAVFDQVSALKQPAGTDPESYQNCRNGKYATIALAIWYMLNRGPLPKDAAPPAQPDAHAGEVVALVKGLLSDEEAVDEDTCAKCGDTYALRDGCDPSKYCDICAQAIVSELEAALRRSGATPPLFSVDMQTGEATQVTASDPIVEAVRAKLLERSRAGLAKYGTGLDRTDLSRLDWLVHLQEELLDAANYAEREIQNERTAHAHKGTDQ